MVDKANATTDKRQGLPTNSNCRSTNYRCDNLASIFYSLKHMAILITFLLGVGNFALHRAVMDSGHPLLGQIPGFFHALGGRFTLILEFLLLVAALTFAAEGNVSGPIAYVIYSVLNSFS
ncbi:MAG: hypothetical protein RIS85_1972, partial [Pseudomonadota bacterium]